MRTKETSQPTFIICPCLSDGYLLYNMQPLRGSHLKQSSDSQYFQADTDYLIRNQIFVIFKKKKFNIDQVFSYSLLSTKFRWKPLWRMNKNCEIVDKWLQPDHQCELDKLLMSVFTAELIAEAKNGWWVCYAGNNFWRHKHTHITTC